MTIPTHVPEPAEFSLVLGGPLFQLYRRTHLSGDALELSHGQVDFDATGQPVLISGASREVTAHKQAELVHEINQPLGALLRNAEAGELFMPDLDEIRAIVADIRKDDQRAGAVIDRMRGLIKRQPLDTRALGVSECLHSR